MTMSRSRADKIAPSLFLSGSALPARATAGRLPPFIRRGGSAETARGQGGDKVNFPLLAAYLPCSAFSRSPFQNRLSVPGRLASSCATLSTPPTRATSTHMIISISTPPRSTALFTLASVFVIIFHHLLATAFFLLPLPSSLSISISLILASYSQPAIPGRSDCPIV